MNTLPLIPGTCTLNKSLELTYGTYDSSQKKVDQLFLSRDDQFEYLGPAANAEYCNLEYKGCVYTVPRRELGSAFKKGIVEFTEFVPVETNNTDRSLTFESNIPPLNLDFHCPGHMPR
jgi:hypothetical protein